MTAPAVSRSHVRVTWAISIGAASLAAITARTISRSAAGYQWPVDRLAFLAWLLLTVGIVLRSARIVSIAALPAMGAAFLGLWPDDGTAWGTSLLIGCLWYVTTELGWTAAAASDGIGRSSAVYGVQVREVSLVVLITLLGGAMVTLAGRAAPPRTFAVQLLGSALVISALVAILTTLISSGRETGDEPGSGVGRHRKHD